MAFLFLGSLPLAFCPFAGLFLGSLPLAFCPFAGLFLQPPLFLFLGQLLGQQRVLAGLLLGSLPLAFCPFAGLFLQPPLFLFLGQLLGQQRVLAGLLLTPLPLLALPLLSLLPFADGAVLRVGGLLDNVCGPLVALLALFLGAALQLLASLLGPLPTLAFAGLAQLAKASLVLLEGAHSRSTTRYAVARAAQ